jgi:hypothetical protein
MQALRSSVGVRAVRPARSGVKVAATARVDKCKKSDIIVSPSILSADFARLGEEVRRACSGVVGRKGGPSASGTGPNKPAPHEGPALHACSAFDRLLLRTALCR